MSSYAVVNPATGETVKEYPEAPDADLRRDRGGREGARRVVTDELRRRPRGPDPEGRGLPRREAEELAAIAVKEMGKPMEQALGEVDFCVDIYGSTPRGPRSSWRTSRSTCWRARAPR